MIVLMTGGTGLIGNALGQKLVAAGHQVRVLTRRVGTGVLSFPAEEIRWDGEAEAVPPAAFSGCQALVHLAGESVVKERWSENRKQRLRLSRIKSAENLRTGALAAGVKFDVVVAASAVGFYGDCGDQVLNEVVPSGQDFLAELCADWEAANRGIATQRSVTARFGVVLSAKGGFLRQVAPLFSMFGASGLGAGKQWMSWIHLEDAASALLRLIEDHRAEGVFNIVAPHAVTNRELTHVLGAALKTFSAPPVPALALKIIYGELSQALLGSQRVVPLALEKIGFEWDYSTLTEALKEVYPDAEKGEIKFESETWIPAEVASVWPFFSSEHNLEELTPKFLNFHVVDKSPGVIHEGTWIDYKLKLRGIPMRWRTHICEWQEGKQFVDEQLKGPYSKWRHRHEFKSLGKGTLMRDTVHFKVPLGWVGRVVALPLVVKEVEAIFSYRNQIIWKVFASSHC